MSNKKLKKILFDFKDKLWLPSMKSDIKQTIIDIIEEKLQIKTKKKEKDGAIFGAEYFQQKFKVGDFTKSGFEITDVNFKPVYKMRKRIIINKDVSNKDFSGEEGWVISEEHDWHIILDKDNNPYKSYKFRDTQYEYIEYINQNK